MLEKTVICPPLWNKKRKKFSLGVHRFAGCKGFKIKGERCMYTKMFKSYNLNLNV